MEAMEPRKAYVVAGGGTGVGKALAAMLAPIHDVVLLSPFPEELEPTARELGCDYRVCDVACREQVECAISSIGAQYGNIYGLVDSAALWVENKVELNTAAEIDQTLAVNLNGAAHLAGAVIPGMKSQGYGDIVFIASMASLAPSPTRPIYAASKAGVKSLADSIRLEVAQRGIRVMTIYPGPIATGFYQRAGKERDMAGWLQPEDVACAVMSVLTQPRGIIVSEMMIQPMVMVGR